MALARTARFVGPAALPVLALALGLTAARTASAQTHALVATPPGNLGAVSFTPSPPSLIVHAEPASDAPCEPPSSSALPALGAALMTHAADPPGLGTEGDLLTALHDAERARLPVARTLSEAVAAARSSSAPLPAGLDEAFVSALAPSPLTPRLSTRVLQSVALLRTDARARRALTGWVRRAGRYRARLEAILASEGVPTDLVWVVAAESSFNPTDVSTAGAAGLWQLMPQTARTYGLRVDAWVDERRDPERATRAAARYLRDLRARLGSWELALAAYNMGYGAMLRAARRFNSTDFDALAELEGGLPYETANYVPRILSLALAARNPRAFGLDALEPDAPIRWDDVPFARSVPLDSIARALGVAPDALRVLNPSLRGGRTPVVLNGAPFALHVPPGQSGADAESRLSALRMPSLRVYQLRHGESVAELARRFALSTSDLLGLSGIATEARAVAGTALLVPDRDPSPVAAVQTERPVVPVRAVSDPPAGRRRVFYRVGHGDELADVARALRVARGDLLSWNSLDETARLLPGLWLQAYVGHEPLSEARVYEASQVELLAPGSEVFLDRAVASDGRTRRRVTVVEGDTMASVARHNGLTVGTLARINRRSRRSVLTPGEELVVYVDDDALHEPAHESAHEPVAEASAEHHHEHHHEHRRTPASRDRAVDAQASDQRAAERSQAPRADRGDSDAVEVQTSVRE